jgi:hypothetical protein
VPDVQLDRDLAIDGDLRREAREAPHGLVDLAGQREGGDDTDPLPVERVVRPDAGEPLDVRDHHRLERAVAVVAPEERLDDPRPERRRRLGHARDEQRRDRLRALNDPLDERLALVGRGGCEAREIPLGLGVRLGAPPVEPGLIVPPVADLASEIGERGEALLADLGEPVELCPGRERGGRIGGCEPALEDAEHRRELSLRALVGLLHPEQRHLERAARHVEREPVVGQRPAERLDERRPSPSPRASGSCR